MEELATLLFIEEQNIVIDFGCGPGHDIKYLKEKYNIIPIGIDASEKMCKYARKNIGINNVICSDNLNSIKNLKFDKIYFKFLLHHIEEPLFFIKNLIDIMKTGSFFAIITMLPQYVPSYILSNYFPTLQKSIYKEAENQLEIINQIESLNTIDCKLIETNINEEIFDNYLIKKILINYTSFFTILSEKEKEKGIEKLKKDIVLNQGKKHLTKGAVYYGRKL
jgi:trans-aconitate methyltransferase